MARITRRLRWVGLAPALLVMAALAWPAAGCQSISNPKDLKTVSITLERTLCYGTCPDYMVTLGGDGSVKYLGRYFVDIPGAQTAKIQPEQIRELLNAFEAIHFFELRDRYVDMCTDLPTEYISLTVDGKSKRIMIYFCHEKSSGPQADLLKLAQQIDAASGAALWIKCDAQCLSKMITSGLDVNSRASDGSALLISAARHNDSGKTHLLLQAGAQANVADTWGYTPLMFAAMANSPEMVRELLAHGADVSAKDSKGFGAVDMGEVGGEVYRILVKAGAKPHKGK